jgi:hypothetical protein
MIKMRSKRRRRRRKMSLQKILIMKKNEILLAMDRIKEQTTLQVERLLE